MVETYLAKQPRMSPASWLPHNGEVVHTTTSRAAVVCAGSRGTRGQTALVDEGGPLGTVT